MKKRWLTDEDGREYRNIPLNLRDQDRALMPWTSVRLHREFRVLWAQGLVYRGGGAS